MSDGIREALVLLAEGRDLTRAQAQAAMRMLMEGEATPAQIGAFLMGLRMKRETAEEIAGLAEVMRDVATRVDAGSDVVDLVGTGGDSARTFNISTVSALVVAAAGGKVAKHGNRGITSGCGAADILEALGVAIDLPPGGVARCVSETGFGFMFAPLYHPAMRHAGPVRRDLGVRTVFNILGPLTNPARARRQLTGVAIPGLGETLATVLGLMGSEHAMVVHSSDALDEITIAGPTEVHETKGGQVRCYSIQPEDVGLERAPTDAIRGGSVDTNMVLVEQVLSGAKGAPRDVVLLNAGAGMYVAGLAESLQAGVERAAESIDSGRVRAKIQQVAEVSQRIKASTRDEVPA